MRFEDIDDFDGVYPEDAFPEAKPSRLKEIDNADDDWEDTDGGFEGEDPDAGTV